MAEKEHIEREAALNVVNGWRDQLIPTYGKNDEYVKCLETVAEHLESLPAADVRPVVHSKWISFPNDGVWDFKCDICHRIIPFGQPPDTMKYCPNCGADMREES